MSKSNVIEIVNMVDLKVIMESCLTVIMGFTLPQTPKETKIMIRKFLKRKAEIFPFITFVYMEVSDKDRLFLNILKGGDEEYPKIYHIRNGNIVLVRVDAANIQSINETFNEVEKYYIKEMSQIQNTNNDDISEPNTTVDNDSNESKTPAGKTTPVSTSMNPKGSLGIAEPNIQTVNTIDPELEDKMKLEKLVLLNKKYKEIQMDFMHNISMRKKKDDVIKKAKEAEKETENKEYKRRQHNVDDENNKEYRKKVRKTGK